MMTVHNLITDQSLISLLQNSKASLGAALNVIDLSSTKVANPEEILDSSVLAQDPSSDPQIREILLAKNKLHSCLSNLRGQNRAAILGVRATKAQTAEARQEVDRLHLQLQNLYYEQRHLMGEINACEGYDHAYARLPLNTLEEYLARYPDDSALAETELMPRRIEHERSERETLEAQRQDLLKQKAELVAENGRRKEDLKKLDERMEKFLEGAKGIMEVLEKEYS